MHLGRERASALERLCSRLARSGSRPRAILACTYPFNASLFGEVLDEIADALGIDGADLTRIPVDVVCDKNLYRGHAADRRFTVRLYNGEELFHPKLLIVLTGTEVVWLSGSGNLTAPGYCSNREIALLEEPETRSLPKPLRQLLGRLPGPAASLIRAETTDAAPRSARAGGRFVTSVGGPIGREFLYRPPRNVRDVIVLAPFFEATSDDPLDSGWLDSLRKAFPRARYRVYLPRLEPGRKPLVQGESRLFNRFRGSLSHPDQLRFFPVPPDPGPLHGKLVAITYRNSSGGRARALIGSPNPSRRALLTSVRNVETAWIVDVQESKLETFLDTLEAGAGRPFEALRFQPPESVREVAWAALDHAIFDPLTKTLSLTWSDGHSSEDTHVFCGARRLVVASGDRVKPFAYDSVHGHVTTRPKAGARTTGDGKRIVPGHCPIEVSLEDRIFLGADAEDMTPTDWLALLGCDPGRTGEGPPGPSGKNGKGVDAKKMAFGISDRVRDLAARLRYVLGHLRVEPWSSMDRDATYKILRGVFESHDPREASVDEEQVWRAWVRAEVVSFAAAAARDRAVRAQGEGSRLSELSRELARAIDWRVLPTILQRQLQHVLRGRQ
jgi:hypothetical protein